MAAQPKSTTAAVPTPASVSLITRVNKFDVFERDVGPFLNDPSLGALIRGKESTTINVADTMEKLKTVGPTLGVAFGYSQGFACCTHVVSMLSEHQTLTHDSQLACTQFLMASMKALDYHRWALQLTNRGELQKALKVLVLSGKLAERMKDIANNLVIKAESLVTNGVEALKSATNDKNLNHAKQEEVRKMLRDLAAEEAAQKAVKADLRMKIQQAEEREIAAYNDGATFVEILTMITGGIFGFRNILPTAASVREAAIREQRLKLQDLERQANAELARSVSLLKTCHAEDNDTLEQAVNSLQVAIRALGRVKTVFENTRQFWVSLKDRCDDLTQMDAAEIASDKKEEFAEVIADSFFNWLVFAKINNTAVRTMESVVASVDDIMSDLPMTPAEANNRLEDLVKQLIYEVEKDNETAGLLTED